MRSTKKFRSGSVLFICSLSLLVLSPGIVRSADGEAIVTGKVTGPEGDPVDDARVVIVELGRSGFTDATGTFRLEGFGPGAFHLQATSPRFGSQVEEVKLTAGENVIDIRLSLSPHRERIVVTGTAAGRGSGEVIQPVQVLDRDALNHKMQPTLGETLAQEPGVSSTQFGVGASRPVIRGQAGNNIRILEGGLGVGDASSTSPDHAVGTDLLSAERVEILRGPATLLFGSTAIGGVVNIIDERIPERRMNKPFGGTLNLRLSSATEERSGAVTLKGGHRSFAWHVDALKRETEDYDIPGNTVLGDPASPDATLPNSATEADGATVGFSWVGENGFVGASVKSFDTLYGVPADEEIRIDLDQKRYDVRGGFDTDFGPFSGIRFSLGATDYEHVELEGDEVGTIFFNESAEGRLEIRHGTGEKLRGVFGLQIGRRDFEAVGDEAFLPPSETDSLGLFVLEELDRGSMRYEFGLRYETRDLSATGAPDRDFDGVSGSFGLAWLPNEDYAVGFSVSRSERLPNAEELYSDGAHLATLSFELGDPDLEKETALGLDLSLRKRTGRFTGELVLFNTRHDDYIYEQAQFDLSGLPILMDGLPLFQFTHDDAEFRGAEFQGRMELVHHEGHDLDIELMADTVRAELSDSGEPLPRIPPMRYGLGLKYRGKRWHASLGARRVAKQDRVASFETGTDGYTLVETGLGYRFFSGGRVHDIILRGSNLTDQEGRVHASRLKDQVLLPGRDVSLSYSLVF